MIGDACYLGSSASAYIEAVRQLQALICMCGVECVVECCWSQTDHLVLSCALLLLHAAVCRLLVAWHMYWLPYIIVTLGWVCLLMSDLCCAVAVADKTCYFASTHLFYTCSLIQRVRIASHWPGSYCISPCV